MKIEFDEVCKPCKGTGLYSGIGERNGAAVVCHNCKGSGCHHFTYEYESFERRIPRNDVKQVFQTNPGICIGENAERGLKLEDFGGMSYVAWADGDPFPKKSENRKFTCPAWWYQSANYDLKPDWDECKATLGSTFSECPHFKNKDTCWARWDKEND